MIEQAQTRIKLAIKDEITNAVAYRTLKSRIQKIVGEAVEQLDSDTLKATVRESLTKFAERAFAKALVAMGVPTNSLVLAFGYIKSGADLQNTVEQLRTFQRSPREFDERTQVKGVGLPAQTYQAEYTKAVQEALKELVDAEPMYDGHVSLRNIAEMTVRYDRTMKNIEALKASGVNLVQSSRHANCSKRCEKWQGGYYTLDNTYRTVDGIQFQPLSNATDQFYTTKKGKVYKNGHITGYNCRHTLRPYKKGYSEPMVSAREVERQRAIDHKMRAYERKIRHYKDEALMMKGQDKRASAWAWNKAKATNAEYVAYARKNHRAFYPDRTKIF